MLQGFPFTNRPTGWYMVGWSDTFEAGSVTPMRLFGHEVVVYRTESGVAQVVDAFCPHLGAHLGHGGKVCGENLQCPFHGWQYGLDGANALIPFTDQVLPRVGLRQWPTVEKTGVVIVWFDDAGLPPQWEWPGVPELVLTDTFYPQSRMDAGVRRIIPHQVMENNPDALHFPFVHGAGEPGVHVRYEPIGHEMHTSFEMKFGAHKGPTWLTPNGPTVGRIDGIGWALGISEVRFTIEDMLLVQFLGVTPVDDDTSMLFSTTVARIEPEYPEEPGGRTKRMLEAQHHQISQDFKIWENQIYVQKPPYSPGEESLFRIFRQWAGQFYPDAAAATP